MKNTRRTLFAIAALLLCPLAFADGRVLLHFAYHSSGEEYLPDPNLATHIVFTSARITPEFTVKIYDFNKPQIPKVVGLKKANPDLKVTLLVGGAKSENFDEALATPESRKTLLDSFDAVMKEYNLDGIDLDWESPSAILRFPNPVRNPQAVANFTLLLKEFSRRFPDKILTVDISGDFYACAIDIAAGAQYVDFFTAMTYDFSSVSHNAPLYASNLTGKRCVSDSVNKYLEIIPPEKLVMGIPFYGRKVFKSKNKEPQQIAHNAIPAFAKEKKLAACRDEVARVPFLMDGKSKVFVFYDDETSIREKARFAKSKNLRGVAVWQIFDDDKNRTLSRALQNEMSK